MLSVIISTGNNERGTVATLAALVPGATAGLIADVVLLDFAGSEVTRRIADVAGCDVLVWPAGASAAGDGLARAARQTRSPWLLFLQAGAVPQQGWIEETMAFIETSAGDAHARGATFRHAPSQYGERATFGIGQTLLHWWRGASQDRGLLISRAHYERVGGHPPTRRPEATLLARLGRRARVRLQSRIATP